MENLVLDVKNTEISSSTLKYIDIFCFEKFGDFKCEKVGTLKGGGTFSQRL